VLWVTLSGTGGKRLHPFRCFTASIYLIVGFAWRFLALLRDPNMRSTTMDAECSMLSSHVGLTGTRRKEHGMVSDAEEDMVHGT
jgi:hypothetical protein